MKIKVPVAAFAVISAICFGGCGGHTPSQSATTISQPVTFIRPGKTFYYGLMLDEVLSPDPKLPAIWIDAIEPTIRPSRYGGYPMTVHTEISNYNLGGRTSTFVSYTYIEQTADGTIYLIGYKHMAPSMNGEDNWVEKMMDNSAEPVVLVPGSLHVGETHPYVGSFYSEEDNANSVESVERIENVGEVQSYVMSANLASGNQKRYFAPALGWFNRVVCQSKDQPDSAHTYTWVLTWVVN